jgi:RNA binding exosome subunit
MSEKKFSYFISYLKDSFDQAVVWHHQTDSYAVHKALNKFYDGILDLTDGLVESVSGIHGRPTRYEIDSPVDYKDVEQVVKYFKEGYETIQEDREKIYQETWIQNQVDEIATLFAETLYLLSLK